MVSSYQIITYYGTFALYSLRQIYAMATFRQRGTSWRAEVCVANIRDGATFDTKAQAKAWAAKRETELREQSQGKLPDHTLQSALERYMNEVSSKKKGARQEITRIEMIIRDFPKLCKRPMASITTDDFGEWRDIRLKVIASGTLRREVSILSVVYTAARKEWKWVTTNPLTDLRLPPMTPHRDRRISQDEADRMCQALGYIAGETPKTISQQIAVMFLLALETAMRAGEIRGLTWDRVFLEKRYLTLSETKNGTKRDVPLSLRAVELIKSMKGIDSKQVFTVHEATLVSQFRRCRIRCQIENLHFHDTRHEACTRLAQKLQMLDLARMIGHKDPRSLMIYYNATATEIAARLD